MRLQDFIEKCNEAHINGWITTENNQMLIIVTDILTGKQEDLTISSTDCDEYVETEINELIRRVTTLC